jgi:hypothetical protein
MESEYLLSKEFKGLDLDGNEKEEVETHIY